ncbi:MAG: hypothetical protein EHM58_16690 [Ignavibacteriae bacterium]|nr:MAG: hypothetical protein EHM58_16690 [Ignavibacteriota bacterium]
MLKSANFKIQVNCPNCNVYHSLSGVHNEETCQNCGSEIRLRNFFNRTLFGPLLDREKYMNGFLSGTIEQIGGSGVNEVGSYKMSYSSLPPYCEECSSHLEEKDIQNAIDNNIPFVCKCGHSMPMRIADGEVKDFHSKAIAVINDSMGVEKAKGADDKSNTVVIKCMTCGAGLELTSNTKRTIICQYCDNENYLPDTIWHKLHPHKDTEPFFIILDLEEKDLQDSLSYFLNVTALKIYEKHFHNFTGEMFRNIRLSDALKYWLIILMNDKTEDKVGVNMKPDNLRKYFYQQFALGIENHPVELRQIVAECSNSIPLDVQTKLAEDKNDDVRLALAKNKNIDVKIIKQLRNDSNTLVSQAAKEQKVGFLKGLFG